MYDLKLVMTMNAVCLALSIVSTGAFIYAMLRQKSERLKYNTDLICFELVLAQFLYYIGLAVANGLATASSIGFLDANICMFQVLVLTVGTGNLAGLHALLALERLSIMVVGKPLDVKLPWLVFLAFSFTWCSTFLVQFQQDTPFQLWGTGCVCYLDVYSSNPMEKIGSILIMVCSAFWIGTMVLSYGYIFYSILKLSKSKSSAVLKNSRSLELQKMHLFRCVLILLVTLLLYFPNILCIFSELVLNYPVPPVLHDMAIHIESLDGLCTVIVLLVINKQNWKVFKKHILFMNVNDTDSISRTREVDPRSQDHLAQSTVM